MCVTVDSLLTLFGHAFICLEENRADVRWKLMEALKAERQAHVYSIEALS